MGRTYLFVCPKCAYQARVAGGPDEGTDLVIHTCVCPDCRRLFDAVQRARLPLNEARQFGALGETRAWPAGLRKKRPWRRPPTFEGLLARLGGLGGEPRRWVDFPLGCAVSRLHRVRPWKIGGRCPRCGAVMERNALPFRLWD
jgi:hypothetical protein